MIEQRTQSQIFDYSDYRTFLADYYQARKVSNPNYSHRLFAQAAGLSSPSHLLMIIKGERNLSSKTIEKFAEGLKLDSKERRFFELLVNYNQTESLQAKAKYFSEIMALKAEKQKLHPLEKERFDFIAKWYVVAIYVLVGLKRFDPSPVWLTKRLGGKITAAQAKEALETLIRLRLVIQSDDGFTQAAGAITVADDTKSIAVFNYHQSMLNLASEALRQSPVDQREMNGATISVPKDKLPELKERIRAFRKEINQLASTYEDADEIYQLNIQLFQLTTPEKK